MLENLPDFLVLYKAPLNHIRVSALMDLHCNNKKGVLHCKKDNSPVFLKMFFTEVA